MLCTTLPFEQTILVCKTMKIWQIWKGNLKFEWILHSWKRSILKPNKSHSSLVPMPLQPQGWSTWRRAREMWPSWILRWTGFVYERQPLKAAGQTDSRVDASLQNQNLRTDMRWVAKRIRKSQKVVNFELIQLNCDQRWPNGEKLASTCVRIWARPKSTQVIASGWPNEMQVEHLTCESVWPGLKAAT